MKRRSAVDHCNIHPSIYRIVHLLLKREEEKRPGQMEQERKKKKLARRNCNDNERRSDLRCNHIGWIQWILIYLFMRPYYTHTHTYIYRISTAGIKKKRSHRLSTM